MLSLKQVREHRDEILRLAEENRVSNVRVFGSVARGTAGPESDLDILVDTKPGCSLFDIGGFLEDSRDIFGPHVDVAVEGGLKERAKDSILRDAVARLGRFQIVSATSWTPSPKLNASEKRKRGI